MVTEAASLTLCAGKNPITGQPRLEQRLDTVRKGGIDTPAANQCIFYDRKPIAPPTSVSGRRLVPG